MLSYWEKTSFLYHDFIIIGSGIVGMSTAIELKERFPQSQVLILERSIFPYGASSRNAGFACVGSISEYLDDRKAMSDDAITEIFRKRHEGLRLLRSRLGDRHINYRENGSYDLLCRGEEEPLEHIDHFNKLFRSITSKDVFSINNTYIPRSDMNPAYFRHCIECHADGEIHTGKMLQALHQMCIERGVHIRTGASAEKYEYNDKGAQVQVYDAARQETIQFHTARLIFCTNAFTKDFFPEEDIQPGRGQVLITQPIPGLKIKGIHHFHQGYFYFREIDGRILFGGGRHLDFEKEQTTDMSPNHDIIEHLSHHLRMDILPRHQHISIDMTWTGIMAFGENKSPLLFNVGNSVWCAARLGGMGVAIGSLLAQELADKIADSIA